MEASKSLEDMIDILVYDRIGSNSPDISCRSIMYWKRAQIARIEVVFAHKKSQQTSSNKDSNSPTNQAQLPHVRWSSALADLFIRREGPESPSLANTNRRKGILFRPMRPSGAHSMHSAEAEIIESHESRSFDDMVGEMKIMF